jgi:ribonuclease-3
MKLPCYRVVGTLGAAHKQTFDVECEVASSALSSAASARRGGPANRRRSAMLLVLKTKLK